MPIIWAILLTGATETRIRCARESLSQLNAMEAPAADVHLHLLIMNEHQYLKVIAEESRSKKAVEVKVNRRLPHLRTLGQLRNFALSLIPPGHKIFVFDDDDYRHPLLLKNMWETWQKQPSACMVQIKNRLNYNIRTNSSWISSNKRGMVHFLGCIDALRAQRFMYKEVNSLEDLTIYDLKNRLLLENDPSMYVRYTHSSNASIWVDQKQKTPQLTEGHYTESPSNENLTKYCAERAPLSLRNQLDADVRQEGQS